MKQEEYDILIADGNIAFYNSCEVTELFLNRKRDNAIFNFYTLVVYEEIPFNKTNHKFLCKPIRINNDYNLGIQRYWLSLQEAENNSLTLKNRNKWLFKGSPYSQFPQMKFLSKQYIPSVAGNRLNYILKNNFHNGSYILEFFDEDKSTVDFLLKMDAVKKLNELCETIKQYVPIDLSIVRDRIGNFIFQFPITILDTNSRALPTWDGVKLNFSWHHKIQNPPDCLLQVESTIDKNYMGSKIEEYNKTQNQIVNIGNLDQINHIKIWRKEPSLILSTFDGSYVRELDFNIGIINPEPRFFEVDGTIVQTQITSTDKRRINSKKPSYTKYITSNLYDVEKKQLEQSLSFKQYNKGTHDDVKDLQVLIKQKDENGAYLWDPFLSSSDILKTLYFSITGSAPLKAIGSINDAVRNVYHFKGKTIEDIFKEYRTILDNPNNNNLHLNLEFRIQHTNFGWAFHDRFLIFPSNEIKRAQVYSLGTSINSYGKNHHILQEISHPQPVVDAFNELWSELNNPECIVWKFPK